jgi:hypothetical protein
MPIRYKPIKNARLFTKKIRYDQIDWNNWPTVIRRFKQQLYWWYVNPIKRLRKSSAHNGFAVVALGCVLLDAMSQYRAGIEQSTGRAFKEFVRTNLPSDGGRFPVPIRIWDEKQGRERQAVDFADVLWSGFRCGILHEAHVPLYGRLWGIPSVFDFNGRGFATYADTGAPCPTVNLNPGQFADEVIAAFDKFIADLKHPNAQLRAAFRKKFLISYGIDIGNDPV